MIPSFPDRASREKGQGDSPIPSSRHRRRRGDRRNCGGRSVFRVRTSLPVLITPALAVGDVVDGNFFDVRFVFAAGLMYFKGSLCHAAAGGMWEAFPTALAIPFDAILPLGRLCR